MQKQVIQPTVDIQLLTVDYWRKRFNEAFPRYEGLTELAKLVGDLDDDLAGMTGYRRIESVKRGKGSLELTAKVVQLMEQIRPAPDAQTSPLRRQKIKTD